VASTPSALASASAGAAGRPRRREEVIMTSPNPTMETRVAKLFGLQGERWMRHANPASVRTRFAVLPLLVLSIWSWSWIGWWCLIPIALSLVFVMVNPMLFPKPRSTRNWASKGVFGERVWSERNNVPVPAQFTLAVPYATYGFQTVGVAVLAYGLIVLDPVSAVTGTVLTQCAKCWYIDRMVLLYEHMKTSNPEYAGWEY
jgi:hypothetical protein